MGVSMLDDGKKLTRSQLDVAAITMKTVNIVRDVLLLGPHSLDLISSLCESSIKLNDLERISKDGDNRDDLELELEKLRGLHLEAEEAINKT
ncbi:MAG: hypothetical protein ACJAS1_001647 [Oleiphilaceae bacterium]|jgi:hypothetical protein